MGDSKFDLHGRICMSRDLLEIFQRKMDDDTLVKVALECAPLIAGLRIANIITIKREGLKVLKHIFGETGITFYMASSDREKLTLILFREDLMKGYLKQKKVQDLLRKMGYPDTSMYELLYLFSLRYRNYIEGKDEFPHEMGIFLGYPIEDVIGFLKNDGKNFQAVGYWKVYQNKREKMRLFERFEEAKEKMILLVSSGMSIKEAIGICNTGLHHNQELAC